jgi:hypothetical protein
MLSESNILELIIVFAGILLLFRKIVVMERHHTLRVFIMTSIFSCAAIYFFFVYCTRVSDPTQVYCLDFSQEWVLCESGRAAALDSFCSS